MDAKIDAILHYLGDWIDDNCGSRIEDCIDDLISMVKKIGEVRTMEGKAVKEIQAKMKTWTDAGIELAYNSGYVQGCKDRDEMYAEDIDKWIDVNDRLPKENTQVLVYCNDGSMWVDDYFCYGFDDCNDSVVAWMPLPEPYRAESEERGSDEL